MNLPNHMTITKNGVILHSNLMSDTCGIHTYIEVDEVKVERINSELTDYTMEKEKKNYGRVISIAIFLISSFVVTVLSEISSMFWLLMCVPYFFLLGHEEISALFRKFCYVHKRRKKKSCKTQELLVMLFSVITSQSLTGTSYSEVFEEVIAIYKEEYEEKWYTLISCTISCIIAGFLHLFLAIPESFSLKKWLFFIVGMIINGIVSLFIKELLEKKDFARYFERFFVSKPSKLESKAVIKGLEEWQRMEDEIFKSRSTKLSQMEDKIFKNCSTE